MPGRPQVEVAACPTRSTQKERMQIVRDLGTAATDVAREEMCVFSLIGVNDLPRSCRFFRSQLFLERAAHQFSFHIDLVCFAKDFFLVCVCVCVCVYVVSRTICSLVLCKT